MCRIDRKQHAIFEQVTWKVVVGTVVWIGDDDSPVNWCGYDVGEHPHEHDGDQTNYLAARRGQYS